MSPEQAPRLQHKALWRAQQAERPWVKPWIARLQRLLTIPGWSRPKLRLRLNLTRGMETTIKGSLMMKRDGKPRRISKRFLSYFVFSLLLMFLKAFWKSRNIKKSHCVMGPSACPTQVEGQRAESPRARNWHDYFGHTSSGGLISLVTFKVSNWYPIKIGCCCCCCCCCCCRPWQTAWKLTTSSFGIWLKRDSDQQWIELYIRFFPNMPADLTTPWRAQLRTWGKCHPFNPGRGCWNVLANP